MANYVHYIRLVRRGLKKLLVSYLVTALAVCTTPMPNAYANPVDGVVSGGAATIEESGKNLNINQTSDRAVIDWRSFNIEADEATRFNQPSASSMTLNRVNDMNPSRILGTLSANGNLVLINPNGVFFGAGSKVDVNGLVATTANISNSDFLNNHMAFEPGSNPNASIINEGEITAGEAGLVGLVAPNVRNSGIITARLGKVHLASGDRFTLDMYGDGLLHVGISDAVQSQLVQNTGTLSAEGGTIRMTAAAGRQVVNSLIDVQGELKAPAVAQKNGKIYIFAEGENAVADNNTANKGVKAGESTVLVSGKLDVSGTTGGQVDILGDKVALLSGSEINASGTSGGGTVHIGGQYKGQGMTPTAKTTVMQQGATINADATQNGDGGEVILWSDGYTGFFGDISLKGGTEGGDGGFVETSGHDVLNVGGTIDASSLWGEGGQWLLDPRDVTISTNADAGDLTSNAGNPDIFTPHSDTTNISVGTITTQLNAGTSVTITTGADGTQAGNITVSNAIQKTGATTATLTLNAAGSIIVNASINTDGTANNLLNIVLNADYDNSSSGNIQVSSATINTNGGYLKMVGGSTASGAAWGTATTSTATKSGVYINSSTISTGVGALTIIGHGLNAGAGASTNYGIYIAGGTTSSTSGTVDVTGTGGNGTSSNYGVYVFTGGAITTSTGNLTVTGTGGNGSLAGNYGIRVSGAGAAISATVGGSITVNGYGAGRTGLADVAASASSTGSNYGVFVFEGGVIKTTGTGNLIVNGYGGNSTTNNQAVVLQTGNASIFSNSSGTVTVNGYGGKGTTNGYGIYVLAGGIITTSTSDLIVNGTGGKGTSTGQSGVVVNGGVISSTAGGSITVNGYGAGRTGLADVAAAASTGSSYGVYLLGGGIIRTTSTGNLIVNGYGGNGSANNWGVYVNAASSSINSNSSGTVTVNGYGGKGTNSNYGIYVQTGGTITTSTSELIVNGTGGNGSSSDNYGVFLSGAGAIISATAGGAITVNGYGAGRTGLADVAAAASTSRNYGVMAYNGGVIKTTGAGNLIVNGYGGNGTLVDNQAVVINAGGASIFSNSTGTVTVNGYGGKGTATNYGVYVNINATITSSGSAVTVSGTGGTGGTTSSYINNHGVYVTGASAAISSTAGTGAVIVNGYGANGYATNYGVAVASSGTITVVNAPLTINGYGGDGASTLNYGAYLTSTISSSGTGTIAINTAGKSGAVNNATSNAGDLYLSALTVSGGGVALTSTGATSINTALSLATGLSIDATGGVTFNQNVSALTLLATTGSSGDITIASGAVLTETATSGNSLTLASGRNFINNSGSGALVTNGTSRWLIYSADPAADTLGSLARPTKRYNKTYAGYAPASVTETGNVFFYSIAPTLTVTADDTSRIYGAANPSFTATVSGTPIDGDLLADTYSGAAGGTTVATSSSNVGTYTITGAAGTLASTLGYQFNYVNGTLTINKASLTVTADNKSMVYGGNALPGLTSTITGYVNGEDATSAGVTGGASLSTAATAYSGAAGSGSNAGTYAITAAANNLSATNYNFSYANGTLTVTPATLTITAAAKSKTYGGSDPALTYTYGSFANGDTNTVLSGSLSRAAGENAGTYAINQNSVSAGSNYTISYTGANLTINKAQLIVTADDKSMVYGDNALPGFTSTLTGYVNGEDATSAGVTGEASLSTLATAYSGAAGSGSNAGTYAITAAANNLAATNYNFSYVDGILTVSPALLTVTASAASKIAGTTDPALAYTYSTLANGDTSSIFLGTLTRAAGESAGSYAIGQGTLLAGDNYTLTFVDGVLTVTPAPVVTPPTPAPAPAAPSVAAVAEVRSNKEINAIVLSQQHNTIPYLANYSNSYVTSYIKPPELITIKPVDVKSTLISGEAEYTNKTVVTHSPEPDSQAKPLVSRPEKNDPVESGRTAKDTSPDAQDEKSDKPSDEKSSVCKDGSVKEQC